MRTTLLRWIAPAVIGVMLSGPAFAGASIAQSPVPISAPSGALSAPGSGTVSATTTSDQVRYQGREAATAGLESWSGGAGGVSIYLGGTALVVVVLLLVLLIIF